jgi:hypothetical protein
MNCFEDTLHNRERFLAVISVCFGCFDTGPKHRKKRNKPKQNFWFRETTRTKPKQIEFRFVSVRTEKKFDCFEGTLVVINSYPATM